jgi:hypothetical protein
MLNDEERFATRLVCDSESASTETVWVEPLWNPNTLCWSLTEREKTEDGRLSLIR